MKLVARPKEHATETHIQRVALSPMNRTFSYLITGSSHLALVALDVEAAVHGDDADGLFLSLTRHDGLVAHTATWSKFSEDQTQILMDSTQTLNEFLLLLPFLVAQNGQMFVVPHLWKSSMQ